jgi:protein-S-isoprenylcysteine O-methyltransferase Ste14
MLPTLSRAVAGQVVWLCFAALAVYWVIAAFGTKRTAERPSRWTNWLTRAALILVVLWLSRETDPGSRNKILWAYTPAIGVTALAVTAVGLIIVVWARVILAGNWSADAVIKEDHELIARGPYRYVRHPIYSGLILMAVGAVLLWSTPVALAVLIGFPVMLWVKLSQEERLLTRHFPDEYPRYKAKVKALIPFVI